MSVSNLKNSAALLSGQGNQVDVAGLIPTILNGILTEFTPLVEVDSFKEFDTTKAYETGDIVRKDNVLYKFKANHTAGAWNATQVDETSVYDALKALIDSLSDALDALEDRVEALEG